MIIDYMREIPYNYWLQDLILNDKQFMADSNDMEERLLASL